MGKSGKQGYGVRPRNGFNILVNSDQYANHKADYSKKETPQPIVYSTLELILDLLYGNQY